MAVSSKRILLAILALALVGASAKQAVPLEAATGLLSDAVDRLVGVMTAEEVAELTKQGKELVMARWKSAEVFRADLESAARITKFVASGLPNRLAERLLDTAHSAAHEACQSTGRVFASEPLEGACSALDSKDEKPEQPEPSSKPAKKGAAFEKLKTSMVGRAFSRMLEEALQG